MQIWRTHKNSFIGDGTHEILNKRGEGRREQEIGEENDKGKDREKKGDKERDKDLF